MSQASSRNLAFAAVCVATRSSVTPGSWVFEPHQALAKFFDEPLLAGREVFGCDADAVADGLGEEVLDAQEIQASHPRRQVARGEVAPLGERAFARQLFRQSRLKETLPLLDIGQLDAYLRDVRITQQVGVQLGRGLRDQQDADVDAREFRRRGPFQESDKIHAFLDTGAGLFACGDQLFRKINDQRDAFPLALVLGHFKEKPREQRRQAKEILRRTLLVKVRVLDIVENFQPFEEPFLHFRRAESQAPGNVVEQHAGALGKKPTKQERFQRHVAETVTFGKREQVENVPVQNKQRIASAVPAPRELERPAPQGQTRGGRRCVVGSVVVCLVTWSIVKS
jgi:hypothetical protein